MLVQHNCCSAIRIGSVQSWAEQLNHLDQGRRTHFRSRAGLDKIPFQYCGTAEMPTNRILQTEEEIFVWYRPPQKTNHHFNTVSNEIAKNANAKNPFTLYIVNHIAICQKNHNMIFFPYCTSALKVCYVNMQLRCLGPKLKRKS